MVTNTHLLLKTSAAVGSVGAALASGVFAVDVLDVPTSLWERLGIAGSIAIAAFAMLRWAVTEMRRQSDLYQGIIASKDGAIAALTQEMYLQMKASSDQLIGEVRGLAKGRDENTVVLTRVDTSLRELTSAIQRVGGR